MVERWKDVPGYEGHYQVSDRGRVRNIKGGRILKPRIQGSGYVQTMLSKNGERFHPLVHRLVAEAFLPNPAELPQVNHINGIKTDNRPENLEWCTISANLWHRHNVLGQPGGRSRPVVCRNTGEVFPSIKAAAQSLSVSKQSILRCCHGKAKATRNKLYFNFLEE